MIMGKFKELMLNLSPKKGHGNKVSSNASLEFQILIQ